MVYIREAHPTQITKLNPEVAGKMEGRRKEPTDAKQRALIASACFSDLKLTMPFLLDDMEDSVEKAWSGWPNRIFIIDKSGKVVMKGRRGPQGVELDKAEQKLREMLGPPDAVKPAEEKKPELPALKDVPDGDYTGSAKGMEGKLTVKVTVTGGKITAVVVTEHGETESMKPVRTALAEVPKRIVEKGGIEVDAVSGATMTSKAIREAVAEALRSAAK